MAPDQQGSVAHPSPDLLFESVIVPLLGDAGVNRIKMFRSPAVKVHGKVFAILVQERLVVKLPRQQVEALVASGHGERFDPGHGRPMKEWIAVASGSPEEWHRLVEEAKAFVADGRH